MSYSKILEYTTNVTTRTCEKAGSRKVGSRVPHSHMNCVFCCHSKNPYHVGQFHTSGFLY